MREVQPEMILDWALVGAVLIGALIFCARIMRRGLTTLDEDRQRYFERIQACESRIREDRKNMSSLEHLAVIRAAVEDLLRLEGNPPDHVLASVGHMLTLQTPDGTWKIKLVMRERALKSTARTLHGKSRWRLEGPGHAEDHDDPASLMRSLHAHLRDRENDHPPMPPHLAARISGLPQARKAP